MLPTPPGHPVLRRTAGAVGAVALMMLGAAPAGAADAETGLVLGKVAPVDGLKPGSEFSVPASFTNTGTAALDKVWMSYSVTRGLGYTEVPSNCVSFEVGSVDEAPDQSIVNCEFDQTVNPGVVYAPEKTLTLKALDRALYDELLVSVYNYDPGVDGDNGTYDAVQGTGPAVKLVERPDETPAAPGSAQHVDVDGTTWDYAHVKVTTENTADFQVTGAQLKGKVGDTVPLTVNFTNAGPAWYYGERGVWAAHIRIKLPAGTSVTKADGFCKSAGSGTYDCGTSQAWVEEQRGETYDFKLKIDKAVPGAKGSVALMGQRPFDTVKSNDTAAILLDVAGAGGTSGSGGSGATGGGGSTASTGGAGSTAGSGGSGSTAGSGTSVTGGSSAESTAGTTDSSPTSGDLASTGSSSTLPLTAAAAGAVLLGAGAVVVARRRAGRKQ